MIDGNLLTKNGVAVLKLTREFLLLKPGDRIKTVKEYAEKLGLGRGTIQTAEKYLEDIDAVELEARGHLGTYILNLDYKKLWEIVGQNKISGIMPLPYSRRYEGFATGLYKAFEGKDISFNMAYMRGANSRLEALLQGKYDFAVMSKLSADVYISEGSQIEIILNLEKYSYVKGHKVVFANPDETEIRDGMRVAIDESSIDQSLLTRYECEGKNIKYVNFSYNQILKGLLEKKIDAAIWNIDEINDRGLNLMYFNLTNPKVSELHEDDTKAVIVAKKLDNGIGEILMEIIDRDYVLNIQRQVLNGELLPNY